LLSFFFKFHFQQLFNSSLLSNFLSCFSLFFFHPLLLDIFFDQLDHSASSVCVSVPSGRSSVFVSFLNQPTERSQVETCGKIKEQLLIQYPEGKIGQVRFQSSQSASRKEEK